MRPLRLSRLLLATALSAAPAANAQTLELDQRIPLESREQLANHSARQISATGAPWSTGACGALHNDHVRCCAVAAMETEIIARLCEMPSVLRRSGYGATIRSVKAAGYRAAVTPLVEAEISAYLRGHPDLVADWYNYSGGQRSTPNWGLSGPGDGTEKHGYRVSWITRWRRPPNWRRQTAATASASSLEKQFPDQFDACAFFIARKAEEFFDSWLARRRHRKEAMARLTE
jgi:hypothetical protein